MIQNAIILYLVCGFIYMLFFIGTGQLDRIYKGNSYVNMPLVYAVLVLVIGWPYWVWLDLCNVVSFIRTELIKIGVVILATFVITRSVYRRKGVKKAYEAFKDTAKEFLK